MASGILGQSDLIATTVTDVYTVPVGVLASLNVNVCNRNATVVNIRLALSSVSGVQSASEYIEYDVAIEPNGVIERTGITMAAGDILTAYSDTVDVSVNVTGIEGAA